MKLAYILAASHSGSTLLSMLLGAHRDARTVGELKLSPRSMGDLDRYRCSCGSLIKACPFWTRVAEGMASRGIDFDLANAGTDHLAAPGAYARRLLKPLHRGRLLETVRDAALAIAPAWRRHLSRTQKRNATLVETIAGITGAKVIVDSSKVALRLKYLLRNPDLDVRVIRLIRDGRAVALTYMDPAGFADAKDPSLRAGGMGGDRRREKLTMAQAAREWRRSNEEAEHVLAGLTPSRFTQVQYEQLCTDTDSTLDRLFTFLGLDPSRRIRGFRSVNQHVVGNGMRLDATSEVELDERWKNVLTSKHLEEFATVSGRTLARYGYA